MATEDTLGYAALSQMLRGQEEQRKVDALRQQNNIEDRREAQKAANNARLDIYKTGEMEKARRAAAEQSGLDRMALERSRSADRNAALKMHDENADLARQQQKELAEAARAQREQQNSVRHTERVAQYYAHLSGMKNAEGAAMFPDDRAIWKMANDMMGHEARDAAEAAGTPAVPVSGTPSTAPVGSPVSPQGVGAPAATPPGAPGPFIAPRNPVNFNSAGEKVKYSESMQGDLVHYKVGQSILDDVAALPDSMFGAGRSAERAAKANAANRGLATLTDQDRAEREAEAAINSKMTKWLSDLLLAKSGKTVGVGEYKRLAEAVGMTPDYIERSAAGLSGAVTALAGAAAAGPLGVIAGRQAQASIDNILGEVSHSILNKPNKQEAVQGLVNYLKNHKQEGEFKAEGYNQPSPFAGMEPPVPGGLPSAPAPAGYSGMPEYRPGTSARKPPSVSPSFLEKIRAKVRKHTQPAAEPTRDQLLDEDD